jgi:hypothetical protein
VENYRKRSKKRGEFTGANLEEDESCAYFRWTGIL